MTQREFDRQFTRLCDHFHLADESKKTIAVDWFDALRHYHMDAVDAGITRVIGDATDTFWPALGKLKQAIQSRIAGMAKVKADCATCQGSSWVEAMPWKAHGRVYTGFQRCPDCGVPEPIFTPESLRTPLTAAEYQAWRNRELPEPAVPLQPSNRSALEALRALRSTRGRMAKAIEGAPQVKDGAA